MNNTYAPADSPTYENEPDHVFEQHTGEPSVHEPSRLPRVPQIEYRPGPHYRSLAPGCDWERYCGGKR